MVTDVRTGRRPGGQYLSLFARTWDGLGLELARWQAGRTSDGLVSMTDHMVFVTFAGATTRTEASIEGGARYVGADFPGAVTFIPAGHERRARHQGGMIDYAAIRLSREQVCLEGIRLRGFTNQPDPFVHQLALALRSEARSADNLGTLFADSVATTLALHLMRRYSGAAPATTKPQPLTSARLRRVLDHVREHLAEDLPLADLAEVAGMDVYQFARGFKQATGQPPHRYVVVQRVERAAELLTGSALPIAEIAHQAGFSSQSHLTTTFRKVVGATPRAYRVDRTEK